MLGSGGVSKGGRSRSPVHPRTSRAVAAVSDVGASSSSGGGPPSLMLGPGPLAFLAARQAASSASGVGGGQPALPIIGPGAAWAGMVMGSKVSGSGGAGGAAASAAAGAQGAKTSSKFKDLEPSTNVAASASSAAPLLPQVGLWVRVGAIGGSFCRCGCWG